MADTKISALTASGALVGTERIPVSTAGVNYYITPPQLQTYTLDSYAGAASIVILGTIGTGVWNGTAIGAGYGGTGNTTYAVGDLLYASASTTLSKLAGVATGNVLISGGVTTAPSWGKVGLTTHVSGTLPVANGGTGLSSLGAGVATFLGTPTSANLRTAVTDETGTGALVFATSPSLTTPSFSSIVNTGTLTLPTSTDTLVGRATVDTLTNKRVTPRVSTVSAPSSPQTPNTDNFDQYNFTDIAVALTIAADTGTPTVGQKLVIRLKDNGTARALTWNAIYRAIGVTLPATTVINKTTYVGFIYNATDTKWDAVAVATEA